MTIEQLTKTPTETDLEVQLNRAIRLAFPWLPKNAVHHQLKFKVQIGRNSIEVDGSKKSREARADAIVYQGETPLAVLELKRSDQKLSPNDELQGLSYAKLHNPSPPFVIITNGIDVKIVETRTGKPWVPETVTEEALKGYLESASKVAKGDLKAAVEALMGTSPAVWMPAIRSESVQNIASRTGAWGDIQAPFVDGWGFPREATSGIIDKALAGQKLTLLVGAPLSGKSNVFREISEATTDHPTMAALYLEAGHGGGVLRSLADALSRALDWPVEPHEARTWLTQVSKSVEHKLLLLIDDLDPSDDEARRSLEDLISHSFGPGLSIAVAVHKSAADRLCQSKNLLSSSAIGRIAERVYLNTLSDKEFYGACNALQKLNILAIKGAEASGELREPWVLRAVTGSIVESLKSASSDVYGVLPPQLSLNLIAEARERFPVSEVLRLYQAVAKSVLEDARSPNREISLQLESLDTFLVRRATLKQHMESEEITKASANGLLCEAMHATETPIFYVRVPDLLASEISKVVAKELLTLADDPGAAIELLVNVASHFPIGDIIAAQAVIDATLKSGSIPFPIIDGLLELSPTSTPIAAGAKIALKDPPMGVDEDSRHSKKITDELEDGERGTVENFYPWLILSHLSTQPLVAEEKDGDRIFLAAGLLLRVGAANAVLRKPGRTAASRRMLVHNLADGRMACHLGGFQELITYSINRFLNAYGEKADPWIDAALEMDSKYLLCRLHIALSEIHDSGDEPTSAWAKATLEKKIEPMLLDDLKQICGASSA